VTCPNKAPRDEHQIHGFLVHFGAPPAAQPASTPLAPWMRPERSPPSEIEVVRSMSRSALVLFFGDVYAYDDREAVRKLAAAPMSGEVLKLRTLKERAVLIVVQGTPGGGKHTFVNSSEGWAGVSTGRALAMYGSALDSTKLLVKHVKMKGIDFDILALGGRGKWMLRYGYLISAHCTATVFMADLSAIDARVLVEEGGGAASGEGGALCRFEHGGFKSQLEEFDALVNSRWFIATACILVLNKKDLLLQKLAALNVPARTYLPDYDGPIEEKPVTEHIKAMFSQKNRFKDKSVFTHVTTIIDPSNAKFVFNAAVAIILEANLRESGLA